MTLAETNLAEPVIVIFLYHVWFPLEGSKVTHFYSGLTLLVTYTFRESINFEIGCINSRLLYLKLPHSRASILQCTIFQWRMF